MIKLITMHSISHHYYTILLSAEVSDLQSRQDILFIGLIYNIWNKIITANEIKKCERIFMCVYIYWKQAFTR